jgi:hypothetical protein
MTGCGVEEHASISSMGNPGAPGPILTFCTGEL